jgi:hypothetical protein
MRVLYGAVFLELSRKHGGVMWQAYACPFGCETTHVETLASEAMAWFYGGHYKDCPNVKDDND